MIQNYLIVAFRNLRKDLIHTSINVWGLAIGMASVFLIAMYIQYELSYDRFHEHADDLYRITWENSNPQTRTPHPMAQALVNDFPEVESAVSFTPLWTAGLTKETHSFHHPDKQVRYDEQNILAVDSTFFDVFDFPIIKGDRKKALMNPGGVLMSESMARKYFGTEEPVGKFLAVDSANYLVEVVAIFKDVPANSHFHFDFLVSYVREKSFDPGNPFYTWKDFGHYNYIRLAPGTDAKELESKLMDWVKKYVDWSEQDHASLKAQHYGFRLQPITDIHLHSHVRWELEANGNAEYIYILGAAAFFTLLIACVNFMNLSTAKSAERAREIGVRKSMGAFRYQLAFQFLAESITIALIAVALSLLLIEASLPLFNQITGRTLQIHYIPYLITALIGAIFIGFVSGIYPALYLSAVKPHTVLKGKLLQSPGGGVFRKSLMVAQFAISMILISSAAIIFNQLSFLQRKNLGFVKDKVLIVPVKNEEGVNRFDAFRNELLRVDGVASVSAASNIPGHQFDQNSIALSANPEHPIDASEAFVDFDFFKAMSIGVKEGRIFTRENPADRNTFVINESAARQLGIAGNAAGKELLWFDDDNTIKGTIIGVVNDFHFQSLHEPIRPLMFRLSGHSFNHIIIRSTTGDFPSQIAKIESVYRQFEGTFGFEFSFLEEDLNHQYESEQRTAGILSIYSGLALIIACFGLFGMSMLMFYQKAKEVSIRKVLGASTRNLLKLMLGDFTRLVILSIFIGVPFSWFIMKEWLKNFSYQIDINPVVFIIAGSVLLIVAWGTLGYFTLKATRINPAEALKND